MSDNVIIFRWIGAICLALMGLLFALVLSPIALIPLLLAAVITAPIPFVIDLKKKAGIPSWASVVVALWLPIMGLFLGGLAAPTSEIDTNEPSDIVLEDSSEVAETEIQLESESDTIIIPEDTETEVASEPESESESESEVAPESESESEEATELPESETLPAGKSFSVHFIDVGQADAALVECDGHYMLIDGGNKEDSNVIYSVLKKKYINKLDIVVGTHAHEDHIGGLPGAFKYATAELTLCPVDSYSSDAFEDFAKSADQKGGGITVPKVGATYKLGSATVEILGLNAGGDSNNSSIVLRIDYGATSFLFTGDAEREAEQALLNAGKNLSATVLKVGHHGSESGTSYVFLREVMPSYAVISVGEGNSYGHPTDAVLSRLRDADVETFRTDLQGDIYCTSDGKTVSFSVDRNADADTLTAPAPSVVESEPTSEGPSTSSSSESTGSSGGGSGSGSASKPDPEPESEEVPAGTDYIGNKKTKKFHEPSCSSVDDMNESNKFYYTGTRDEMIDMGYVPCKRCYP